MEHNKQALLDAIERKRAEMNALSGKYPLNSDIIIKASQELDLLLNQYQALAEKSDDNDV